MKTWFELVSTQWVSPVTNYGEHGGYLSTINYEFKFIGPLWVAWIIVKFNDVVFPYHVGKFMAWVFARFGAYVLYKEVPKGEKFVTYKIRPVTIEESILYEVISKRN